MGDPLDADAGSALSITTLEVDGCEVCVDGAPVPHKVATTLHPGSVLSFGGVTFAVERDARAHALWVGSEREREGARVRQE